LLTQLEIRNIAIIDEVSIEFEKGLNILTGETGAGKSVIIDSINAILGERLTRDVIRTGTEKATVQAVFQIDPGRLSDFFEKYGMEPEEDGSVVVSREFTVSGRNTCRLNGRIATVSILGERIIDIHGQHDNQSLLRPESHIGLLDSFGGEKIKRLLLEYSGLLERYKLIRARLKELSGDMGERERRLDLLKFQADEIKRAKLKPGEDEELGRQRIILANSEKIIESLSSVHELLFSGNNIRNSASDNINEALQELAKIARFDAKYEGMRKALEDISYQLDDIIEQIRGERDGIEYNPDMLEQVEERLDLIFRLKRKYGETMDEVLKYLEDAERQIEEMKESEGTVKKLASELDSLGNELYRTALMLNNERREAAKILENRIGAELEELEMKRARFKVQIDFDETKESGGERNFLENGLDRVTFMISPNAGEPLKQLAKIASGGEMSRIMLAIKTILANVDSMPVLIFDEIDMGISGKAAQKVGEKLSYISKNHQVICVTHLAQIGCMADQHFLIEKTSDENSTKTTVKKLSEDGSRDEIARILGGSAITDITKKHAEEMLENAKRFKNTV